MSKVFPVSKYVRKCSIAQTTAKHSFSVIIQFRSVAFKVRLAYAITFSFPSSSSWDNTAPILVSDASVYTLKGLSKLEWATTYSDVSISFNFSNDCWQSWSYFHSGDWLGITLFLPFLPPLNRLNNGSAIWAKLGIKSL